MSKILLAHQDAYAGDDLKFLLEDKGHSVDWYKSRDDIHRLHDNIPKYDFAIVDRCIEGVSSDEMIQKLKQEFPKKKVICLTHMGDPCKHADKNLGIVTEEVLKELFEEVELK